MLNSVKSAIHRTAPRWAVNAVWNAASDLKDLPTRLKDHRPRPWRLVHNVGGGDFYAGGARLFARVREAAGLEPFHRVLDIGCGAGRLAIPMCAFLNESGAYTGFDIARPGLTFAERTVRGVCAIRFVHADLGNREYRRSGADAAGYRFPADDSKIDRAVATSLFTHVEPDVAAAYLREAGRVLKPGGRLFMTAFLIDDVARAALADGRTRLTLVDRGDGAFVADPRNPERAIGFDRARVDAWCAQAGLTPVGAVRRGDWREPEPAGEFQDVIVLEKA